MSGTLERIVYVVLGAGATHGMSYLHDSLGVQLSFWEFSGIFWVIILVVGAALFGRGK